MTSETWARLTRLMGVPCLEYLLALRAEQRPQGQSAPEQLTREQSATLEALAQAMPFDLSGSEGDLHIRFEVARMLGSYVPRFGSSWAAVVRQASGGSVEIIESDDVVLRELLPQLRDVYPVMLLPRAVPGLGPDLSASLYGHPSRSSFEAAVMADEDLAKLFPDESRESGPTGSYIGPNRGGGIQLWGLPAQVLTTAFDWARFEAVVPSLSEVAEKLTTSFALLRSAVRGETVEVPARIALAGARLPDDLASFEIGESRLRRRDARDDWLATFTGTDRKLSGTTTGGETIEIDYAGDIIIETTMKYRVQLGELSTEDWPSELSALRQSLEHTVEAIRLGLALVPCEEDPILVVQSSVVTLDLLGHGPNIGWRNIEQNAKLVPRQLAEGDVERWRRWAGLILELNTSTVEIAVRRVLLAIGERQMPEDVLIDSVMAWENLFGAEQETTFRVCASLAWLLTSDAEERKILVKELKKIYALRSRVVHGSSSLKPSDSSIPRRALDVALEALRAILQHRADLLSEPDGPSRSNRVLLGD